MTLNISFESDYIFEYYVSERFNIQASPQVGFLIKSDFVINIDLGYQIIEKFLVDSRYSYGLSELGENLGDLQNSVFQISLGYRLD